MQCSPKSTLPIASLHNPQRIVLDKGSPEISSGGKILTTRSRVIRRDCEINQTRVHFLLSQSAWSSAGLGRCLHNSRHFSRVSWERRLVFDSLINNLTGDQDEACFCFLRCVSRLETSGTFVWFYLVWALEVHSPSLTWSDALSTTGWSACDFLQRQHRLHWIFGSGRYVEQNLESSFGLPTGVSLILFLSWSKRGNCCLRRHCRWMQ